MKTRQDYMDKKASHADYYRQFVTPGIIEMVKSSIGIDAIAKSKDEHFNDIPLAKWDAIHVVHSGHGMYSRLACGEKIKLAGEGNSASTGTCILKQAARMIKEAL
jgi:predicted ester cyclase